MRSAWYVLFGFGLALVLTTAAYLLAAFGPNAGDAADAGPDPVDAAGPDVDAPTNGSGNESTPPPGNVTRRAADPPSATRT